MPKTTSIIVYGKPTSKGVPPVRDVLHRARAAYEYIDVSEDKEALLKLQILNQGFDDVPTLVFPDKSKMIQPKVRELEDKLREMGYNIAPITLQGRLRVMLQSPSWVFGGMVILISGAVSGDFRVILLGLALFGLFFFGRWWGKQI